MMWKPIKTKPCVLRVFSTLNEISNAHVTSRCMQGSHFASVHVQLRLGFCIQHKLHAQDFTFSLLHSPINLMGAVCLLFPQLSFLFSCGAFTSATRHGPCPRHSGSRATWPSPSTMSSSSLQYSTPSGKWHWEPGGHPILFSEVL